MSRGEVETFWLNKDFMSEVFSSSSDPSEVQVEWAVKVGENHVANIFRVKFKGTSVIVKAERRGAVSTMPDELEAFQKELQVYSEYAPLVKELVGEGLTPEYFKVGDLLVLEDLKVKGYVLEDRLGMIGLERALAVFKCIGQFHAAGMVIDKRHPEGFSVIRRDTYTKSAFTRQLFTALFKGAAKATNSWPELSKYSQRLDAYSDVTYEKINEELNRETELMTLIHGDFHCYNIMFHKDSARVTPKLVDFQFTCRTTIAWDILYMTSLSIQDYVLDNHYDEILSAYTTAFNEVLARTEIPYRLTLQRLKEEINAYPRFELHAILTRGAIFLSPEGSDLTECAATNRLHEMCQTEVYRRRLGRIIKKHANSGIF